MVLIFTIAFVKEFVDDRARRKADNVTNNKIAKRYNPHTKTVENVAWKNIGVGDIIEAGDGDMVPADMVVLSSSEDAGNCYVDTCNLDGENNLKSKVALKGTKGWTL